MYTLYIAVDQMIFLHFSDMIAASACDLLCNCFFGNLFIYLFIQHLLSALFKNKYAPMQLNCLGNTYISYKKSCNCIFVVMYVYIVDLAVYLINL